jgi:hypothetical protein
MTLVANYYISYRVSKGGERREGEERRGGERREGEEGRGGKGGRRGEGREGRGKEGQRKGRRVGEVKRGLCQEAQK